MQGVISWISWVRILLSVFFFVAFDLTKNHHEGIDGNSNYLLFDQPCTEGVPKGTHGHDCIGR